MEKIEARLILGDCREELIKLADNSVDLIFNTKEPSDKRFAFSNRM